MKIFIFVIAGLLAFTYSQPGFSKKSYGHTSHRATHVKGYTTKSGRYVSPHMRTKSNNTGYDNYSTKGNSNPYTGKAGTKRVK